ncbi:MAG: hypothetical protein KC897_06210 [Candidatus Omnitrophica bacterium]|nr:hypothetical protein [Candidatus Omnitrophota bacterium]MCA9403357.1 hypothetical protein [Candidatus Omnitrophota bacterium]MCB9721809.1 hypothetical protein [Candidatus Omnitrophota bacterium]
MPIRKLDNQGVVLITVVVIILLILMLVTSIISMNVSQILLSEDEYKRLQNQVLAEATLNLVYGEMQTTGTPAMSDSFTFTLNNITHTASYSLSPGGLLGASIVDINVTY